MLKAGRAIVARRSTMIAVIFEVWPAEGQVDAYLDIAHELRAELDRIDGFISV